PADLPLRVVVPTIERYMLGKIPMISCRIDPKLFIDIQASSLVFPFQFRTPRLIDSITTGRPIETDRSRPPCTTHRPVAMLKDMPVDHVVSGVAMSGETVGLIIAHHTAALLSVADRAAVRSPLRISGHRAGVSRDVQGYHEGLALIHQAK